MRSGDTLTADAVGVAEFSGTAITTNPDGYQVVAVDGAEPGAPRTYLLAMVTTVVEEPDGTAYARAAVDSAAERITQAGNLQSPVALRGALEQALAEVQRLGLASPSGAPPGVALIGLSVAGSAFSVARTPDAMAYVVGVATERVFGPPGGNGAGPTGGHAGSTSRAALAPIELRRGQLEAGARLVLLAGPGWRNVEPHRVGSAVRASEPVAAAEAILQLSRDRTEDPVAVAVVAPVGLDTPALDAEVDETDEVASRRNGPFEEESAVGPTSARGSRRSNRNPALAGGEPAYWLNIWWMSPMLAMLLIGAVIGAVLGDQVGKVNSQSADPLNDRYIELLALLYSNNPPEEPGLIYERLRALGPLGEPDALRRVAVNYSRSTDAGQRDLAPKIAKLAEEVAARGPQPISAAPPAAIAPAASPAAPSPAATARPGATVASPVSGTQPTPLPQQPATTLASPTATASPTPEEARPGRINPNLTESVNMRAQPRRNAGLVQQIRPGAQVEILESVEGDAVEAGNTTWYRVRVGQVEGFVYSRFVVAS